MERKIGDKVRFKPFIDYSSIIEGTIEKVLTNSYVVHTDFFLGKEFILRESDIIEETNASEI